MKKKLFKIKGFFKFVFSQIVFSVDCCTCTIWTS